MEFYKRKELASQRIREHLETLSQNPTLNNSEYNKDFILRVQRETQFTRFRTLQEQFKLYGVVYDEQENLIKKA